MVGAEQSIPHNYLAPHIASYNQYTLKNPCELSFYALSGPNIYIS